MKQISKNVLDLIWENKSYLFMPLIIMPIVMVIAVIFTINVEEKVSIAAVSATEAQITRLKGNDAIILSELSEEPPFSELVDNTYEAVVMFTGEDYQVKTVKNQEIVKEIDYLLTGTGGEHIDTSQKPQDILSTFIGFVSLVVFFLGITLFESFYQEKGAIASRIVVSGISVTQYFLGHVLVVLGMLFTPMLLVLLGAKYGFYIQFTQSFMQVIISVLALCFFAATFGGLLSSYFRVDEDALNVGMVLLILTTLVSGSVVPVTENKILDILTMITPQRQLLNFVEQSSILGQSILSISYVFLLSVGFLFISVFQVKKKLLNN